MKLGKLPPKNDPRSLKLARYLGKKLPPPPPTVDYTVGVSEWPMYQNDRYGDCTCATAAHMIQAWTQASRKDDYVLTDSDVLKAYSDITGFDPTKPETDRGAVEHDVLMHWKLDGIGGRKIGAWVDVDLKDLLEVKQAIWLFGGLYIGVALPKTAQNQDFWEVSYSWDGRPGTWGGHAVNIVGYDNYSLTIVTWGRLQKMSWRFWLRYVDEAHAVLTEDWLNPVTGVSPPGLNVAQLQEDLRILTA